MKKIILLLFYILFSVVSIASAKADYYGYPSNYPSVPLNNGQYSNRYPSNYPPAGTHVNTNPNYPQIIYEPTNGTSGRSKDNYPEDNRYRVKIREHY